MREEHSFQMIPVLTKLEIFLFRVKANEMFTICAHSVSLRQGPRLAGRDTRQGRRTLSDRITVGDTSCRQAALRTYIVS